MFQEPVYVLMSNTNIPCKCRNIRQHDNLIITIV